MKIYVVAGEPSGDLLASGLMNALLRVRPDVEFRGIGGETMAALGLKSLFDISEISVMGFFEVLPRLPLIMKRIRQTVKDIEIFEPDVLVTVDSWGFVSALLKKLRRREKQHLVHLPVIHYVAPQVWAWKKGRARSVAKLVDRLLTLLPNEGQYFEKYGLKCDFVGHPVVERVAEMHLDPESFRAARGIPAGARIISVLPGSRRQEVKRLQPIFNEAIRLLREKYDNLFVIEPTLTSSLDERLNNFAISTIALAKSGTVSLELAAVGVPHLIAYTFGKISNLIAPHVIKVQFANLLNIIAGREIIPEFVLSRCRPELIAECASRLLDSPSEAVRMVVEAQKLLKQLRLPDILPSDKAAEVVLEVITNNPHKIKSL